MTKEEKKKVMEMPTVGYWSMMGGVEVKMISCDITEYAIIVAGTWYGHPTVHKLRIYIEEDDSYIRFNGIKLWFSECIANR